MKIADLRLYAKKIELIAKIVSKNEARDVVSKLDNSTHKVTEALLGDETGTILLTLWDNAIESIEIGKTYQFSNAYTSLFKNSLRLNLGRYGTFVESLQAIEQANESNNLSEKELGK